MSLRTELNSRILVLDGAMGTMIQRYGLTEAAYRGNRFAHWQTELKGNNDLLALTQSDVIAEIHRQYLAAGADIIETNTFNAQQISQADYGLQELAGEINLSAARLARQAADEFTKKNPLKPRFVAGSMGPTNKSLSLSPDVLDPALRTVDFDRMCAAYQEQATALIEGGVDALLIETIFDTLNAKAAIVAAKAAMEKTGKTVELMLSATVSDTGGRLLAGQTIAAFIASTVHAEPLSVGLNCSFGAKEMMPFLKEMSRQASCYVSAYPNAGLPNALGNYDQTPETMAKEIELYIENRLVNIIGGCCGTTPEHIARYAEIVKNATPPQPQPKNNALILSGLDIMEL